MTDGNRHEYVGSIKLKVTEGERGGDNNFEDPNSRVCLLRKEENAVWTQN